jgi:F-type H+-transporting ATPase subunit gamma
VANLKDIKNRIGSVKKTKQITSAMKLVAAAKLKRATDNALAARPYREQLSSVLRRVASVAGDDVDEPLLQSREQVSRILVVVLTSDRGLCGAFNNGLVRKTVDWLEERDGKVDITLKVFGKKGVGGLKRASVAERRAPVVDYGKDDKSAMATELARDMVAGFVDGEFDEVYVVYNRFVNTLSQVPTFDRVLPLSIEEGEDDAAAGGADYRYEPDGPTILANLLPLYLQTLVLQAFLETEAGEHAARMTAMENATKNASELIDQLTLDFNRARQAAITTEIIEITSGAAAL